MHACIAFRYTLYRYTLGMLSATERLQERQIPGVCLVP